MVSLSVHNVDLYLFTVLYGNSPLDRASFESATSLYEKRKLVHDKLIADYLKTAKVGDTLTCLNVIYFLCVFM